MNNKDIKTIGDIVTHHNEERYKQHNLEVTQLTMHIALLVDAKGKEKRYDEMGNEIKDPIVEYTDKVEKIKTELNSGTLSEDPEHTGNPQETAAYWRDQLRDIEGRVDKDTKIKENILGGIIRQIGFIKNPAIITAIILLKWLGSRKRLANWKKVKVGNEWVQYPYTVPANFISDELIKEYLPGFDLNTFKGIAQKFPYWFKIIELEESNKDGQYGYWLHKDFAGSIPQGQGYNLTTWCNDAHKKLNEMVYHGFLAECIKLSTDEANAKSKLKTV